MIRAAMVLLTKRCATGSPRASVMWPYMATNNVITGMFVVDLSRRTL